MKYRGVGDFSNAGLLMAPQYAAEANFPAAAAGNKSSFAYADDVDEMFFSTGAAWVNLTQVSGISGSGTSNQMAYFTGTSAIGSSTNGRFNGTDMALGGSIVGGNRLTIIGTGLTSSTFALRVHNSNGVNDALCVRDDGRIGLFTASPVLPFHLIGSAGMGDSVTAGNSTRALNLAATNAVMRILRISADSSTAAPAMEIMHRTTSDGANTVYYDIFGDSSGLSFRDRFNLADVKVYQLGLNGAATNRVVDVETDALVTTQTFSMNSTGVALAGLGHRTLWQLESSTTNDQDAGALSVYWTTATHGSRTSNMVFYGVNNAGSLGEMGRWVAATAPALQIASAMGTPGSSLYLNAGITTGVDYTLGNSANVLFITSSNAGPACIRIGSSTNANTGALALGPGGAITIAAGFKPSFYVDTPFAPTSGNGAWAAFDVSGAINQTGGANGISYGIRLRNTITAATDYRALYIETDNANCTAIYQAGSNSKNYLVAKTAFGSTTNPTDNVTITGNNRVISGQQWTDRFALTDGATINTNWNNSNTQSVTLGGNRTMAAPTNPKDGARYTYIIRQDGTGSRTLTWFTIKWAGGTAPTLTTTANKYDIITLIYDGTNYYGTAALNF